MITLTLVAPSDIMRYWDYIKDCIVLSLPPYIPATDEVMIQLQETLLLEQMQCWLARRADGTTLGVMTTTVVYDDIAKVRNLLIYSVTVTEPHDDNLWFESLSVIQSFALDKGCKGIIGYTQEPKIVSIVQKLGGDTSWTLIQLPLRDNGIKNLF